MDDAGGRRPASLRVRLLLLATVTVTVSLGAVGLALDAAYRQSADAGLRQQMDSWAYALMAAMELDEQGQISLSVAPADPLLQQPGSGVYGLILGEDAQWQSPSALGIELPPVTMASAGQQTFSVPGEHNYYQRRFGLSWQQDDGRMVPLTVALVVHERWLAPELTSFRRGLWQSLGAAALLLALAQLLFTRISLRPLERVAADVAELEAGRSNRLPGPYPRELEPLTRNVDQLLAGEQANQARYRNALDSLAHSLKTPLAVLKAQPATEPAQRQALEDMELLIATRLERAAAGTRRTLAAPVEVAPLAERLVAALRKVHSHALRKIECTIAPGLLFFGEERDLMELLGNLLDNACKYGDGTVRLEASRLGEGPRPGLSLVVGNDGEALDPARFSELLTRGLRGDERGPAAGHGLGLSIVAELVRAYGGELHFGQSPLGGAELTVTLPPGYAPDRDDAPPPAAARRTD